MEQQSRLLQTFSVGSDLFAVLTDEVMTLAEWREPAVLPQAPASVLGVVSIQGRMLTVLNLSQLLEKQHAGPRSHILALNGDEQQYVALSVTIAQPVRYVLLRAQWIGEEHAAEDHGGHHSPRQRRRRECAAVSRTLIELGAGFHPDFSGRENVYLNGLSHRHEQGRDRAALRFDRRVRRASQDVVDDPVRTYSSGMYMRLGFSVAVHADPDVLLIDEILAVGDESFVTRCYERIAAFQSVGKTLVLVSHSLESIERWCHEAVWIDEGRVAARGYPTEVTRLYHAAVGAEGAAPAGERSLRDSLRPGRLAAVIRVLEPPARTPEPWHHVARVLLEVENVGDTVWRALPPTRRGTVMVGGRLHSGERFLGETLRALIPRDVHPKERACVEFKFKLPGTGRYRVDVDLVDEGICWFSERGSTPLPVEVTI